jgi:SnoaL-like domain
MKIDPNRTFRVVEDALARETNPLHRAHLENILEHFKGEAAEDIPRILKTLSPDAEYIFVGPSFAPPGAAKMVLHNHAEIRAFYEGMLANTMREMQYDVEEMIVDDNLIYQRGTNRIAVTGSSLVAQGFDVLDDPGAYYMQDVHAIVIFPFDKDGLCLGEQVYQPRPPTYYLDAPIDRSEIGELTAAL